MGKRKRAFHGQKRKVKQTVTLDGTGTQTKSISLDDGELFEISTDACASTALTLDVTQLYDGAEFRVYYNSLHASDTLVFTFNGAAEKNFTDASTGRKVAITGADQNLVKGYIIDSTDGSEVGGISWEIF